MGAIINENNTAENGMGVEKGIVGKKSVCGRAAGEGRATRRVFVGLILFREGERGVKIFGMSQGMYFSDGNFI
jgi:hypothetical protein